MKNQRKKGTGTITRTKNGRFKGTIGVTSSLDNKRHRISKTFDTLEEVQDFFKEVTERNIDFFSPTSVSEYWEHYLELKANVYRASTLAGCINFYEKHVKNSVLVKTKFYELDATIINRFFLNLSTKGYASSTLTRWRKNFKSILDMAVYEGYLKSNPMRSQRVLKKVQGKPPRPITPFTKQEVRNLLSPKNLSKIPLVHQTYILLAFLTGARPQEILALEDTDIRDDGAVSYTKSIGYKGKLQTMMKTPYSVRIVPLPEKYFKIIQDNKKALPPKLFRSDKSAYGYLSKDNVGAVFKKYVFEVLGTTNHRLYDTRHTYATLLITVDKVDVKTVSRLLGHSQVETTLKYYTHVSTASSCHTVLHV